MSERLERVVVWLGGGAFVSSLAFCAYDYLIRWASFHQPYVRLLAERDRKSVTLRSSL